MTVDISSATRWGKGTRANSNFAREQILDAALVCYERDGIIKTTVEHVAREAKVSRTTVYRYFANRDEVLTGVVVRESVQVLQKMQKQLRHIDNLADYLVEAMVYLLQIAPKMPLYPYAFGSEGAELTSRLCYTSEELFALGTRVIEPLYEKAVEAGEISKDVSVIHVIEWVVRILLSYMTTPSALVTTEDQQRAMLRTFLRPAFVR